MMMMTKVFTLYLNLMKKINIDTKPLNVFDYLKSLSQEAEDLMDEIMQADADKDINIYKLVFIGSNRKKFNFDILGCH